jgi:glutamate-ammonia-ligase adenylyltransferase
VPGLGADEFLAPDAAERLARLDQRAGARRGEAVALCRLAPDPDLALAGLDRWLDAAELPRDRDLLEALVLLSGPSRLAAKELAKDPALLRRVARSHWLARPRPETQAWRHARRGC